MPFKYMENCVGKAEYLRGYKIFLGFLQEEINNYNSEEFRASDSYQDVSVLSATAMVIIKAKLFCSIHMY